MDQGVNCTPYMQGEHAVTAQSQTGTNAPPGITQQEVREPSASIAPEAMCTFCVLKHKEVYYGWVCLNQKHLSKKEVYAGADFIRRYKINLARHMNPHLVENSLGKYFTFSCYDSSVYI